jgi:hypothetical protein
MPVSPKYRSMAHAVHSETLNLFVSTHFPFAFECDFHYSSPKVHNCSICGESTRLFVSRVPLCVTCYEAGPEKRKVRRLKRADVPVEPVKLLTSAASDSVPSFGDLVPQAQKALVTFLQVDLDFSSTLLETAEISASRTHIETALERVRRALQTVRRLGTRVNDPVAQADIHNRLDGLEMRLETFPV